MKRSNKVVLWSAALGTILLVLAVCLGLPFLSLNQDTPTTALRMSRVQSTATPQSVKELLQMGADAKWTQPCSGVTLLTLATDTFDGPDNLPPEQAKKASARWNAITPEICQILIKAGSDVNARQTDGMTVRTMACSLSCRPELVQLLLENGANPNPQGKSGDGPLWSAVNSNGPQAAKLLIKAWAKSTGSEPGCNGVVRTIKKSPRRGRRFRESEC